MSANDVARDLGRRISQLEGLMKQPASAELRQVAKVATDAAVDGRQAIRVYKQRGFVAAKAEQHYRLRQMATGALLAHMKAEGQTVTPFQDWDGWEGFRRAMRARDDQGVFEPEEVWRARPVPISITVGDLSLAKSYEAALNGLCADARYIRDTTAHAARSAAKALAMFDRIVNLMQSVMKGDKVEERLTSGLATDLGFDDDDDANGGRD
jgi:hypothetical protein